MVGGGQVGGGDGRKSDTNSANRRESRSGAPCPKHTTAGCKAASLRADARFIGASNVANAKGSASPFFSVIGLRWNSTSPRISTRSRSRQKARCPGQPTARVHQHVPDDVGVEAVQGHERQSDHIGGDLLCLHGSSHILRGGPSGAKAGGSGRQFSTLTQAAVARLPLMRRPAMPRQSFEWGRG